MTINFGFRNNHSKRHALIEIIEKIKHALDSSDIATGIYLDLKKAFDTVDHIILLKRFHHYGIREHINKWVESYLTGRKQYVHVDSSN